MRETIKETECGVKVGGLESPCEYGVGEPRLHRRKGTCQRQKRHVKTCAPNCICVNVKKGVSYDDSVRESQNSCEI